MKLRTVASYAAVVIGTLALLFLVWVFRQALILFIFSLAFAAAARPSVDALTNRGVRRTLALIIVYAAFLGFLLGGLIAVGGPLLKEMQQLGDALANAYDRIWEQWPKGTQFQQTIAQRLPPPADLYQSFSPEGQNSSLQGVLGFTLGSVTFLGQLATILILSIYWSIDRVHFERLWLSLLPVEVRARARDIWRGIENDFGAYVRSELFQSILASLFLGVGLWLLGVRYPILLAIFGSLAWLIPWLGGVAAVLVIGAATLPQGVIMAIFAGVFTAGILIFLQVYIEPRFFRRGQFSSLLSMMLILALVEPFGLLGFIVAPPLAAALELIFRYNLQTRPQTVEVESARRISELRARILAIRDLASANAEPMEPQTVNMLTRLEALVKRADSVIETIEENNQTRSEASANQLRAQG